MSRAFLFPFFLFTSRLINKPVVTTGYLLHQRNYQNNKELAELGKQLYENNDLNNTRNELNLDQTVALKSHLDISRNQMDFLKSFCNPYIKIPN